MGQRHPHRHHPALTAANAGIGGGVIHLACRDGEPPGARQRLDTSIDGSGDAALSRFADDPLYDYKQDRDAQARASIGEERAKIRGNFTLFPNMSGLGGLANIRMWHPKGPNKFEIWSWTVVDADAPDEVKREQQLSSSFTEGTASVVEVDDGENWNLMGQLLENGYQTRKMPCWHGRGQAYGRPVHQPGCAPPWRKFSACRRRSAAAASYATISPCRTGVP